MEYKIINGTSCHVDTPLAIIDKLECARLDNRRVKITYKDGVELNTNCIVAVVVK